jgi:hypothetical protein
VNDLKNTAPVVSDTDPLAAHDQVSLATHVHAHDDKSWKHQAALTLSVVFGDIGAQITI